MAHHPIRNERDKILQTAAVRVIVVPPPDPIIVEGYTGISLVKDGSMFVATSLGAYGVKSLGPDPSRMTLTATRKGITPDYPVTWQTGSMVVVTPGAPAVFDPTAGSSIILTDTPDPLVKTIEASSYPRINGRVVNFPNGAVQVSIEYGSRVFTATVTVATFTG